MMKLGVIGCGNMGEALVRGVIEAELHAPKTVVVTDAVAAQRAQLARRYKVRQVATNDALAKEADVILLAVKPQHMAGVLDEIAPYVSREHIVISIAAGITLTALKKQLKNVRALARVMPNMPAQVGCGISALSYAKTFPAKHKRIVRLLFGSVGSFVEIQEKQMDAVTAVSGSGPAYFFQFVQALADAGIKCGLDAKTACVLAQETGWGALALLDAGTLSPKELIDKVASKGGTTEAALSTLRKGRFDKLIADAVKAAAKRSKELAR